MSNLSDTKKITTKQNADTDLSIQPESKRWSFIQKDLTQAMDTWQELEKAEIGISPEEEQLVKIKIIIVQLKEKLEQF